MKIKGVGPGPIREHYINKIISGFYFTLKWLGLLALCFLKACLRGTGSPICDSLLRFY
jgi:hypothetical protein